MLNMDRVMPSLFGIVVLSNLRWVVHWIDDSFSMFSKLLLGFEPVISASVSAFAALF